MNKIKEHHNVERQVRGWQIGLAEGAFSRGMRQAGLWEQSSPFPLLSLAVLFFPLISPAPHLSPLAEAPVKARVSPTVVSFSSIQRSQSCWARQACPAPWLSLCPELQEQQRCLTLGEAAPSVFQWNIWWDFSFHTTVPFNSSAVFSSLFPAKSTSKLWRLFPFVKLPVSNDLVSHPWLGNLLATNTWGCEELLPWSRKGSNKVRLTFHCVFPMPLSSKKMQARLGSSAAAGQSHNTSVMETWWEIKFHYREKQLAKGK